MSGLLGGAKSPLADSAASHRRRYVRGSISPNSSLPLPRREPPAFRSRRSSRLRTVVCAAAAAVVLLIYLLLLRRRGGYFSLPPVRPLAPNIGRKKHPFRAAPTVDDTPVCNSAGCSVHPADSFSLPELRERGGTTPSRQGTEDYAAVTLKGLKGRESPNQDRSLIVYPLLSGRSGEGRDDDFLLGLFDGHGLHGEGVADIVASDLAQYLHDRLLVSGGQPSEKETKQTLNDAFVHFNSVVTDAWTGGSTATVALRICKKIYVANTGDSRTVVASFQKDGGHEVIYRTRADKPDLLEERARIEKMGGEVYIPDHFAIALGDSSRVLVTNTKGVYGLAMSRSIGDWDAKSVGVIAEPIVGVVDLEEVEGEIYVLSASDGLWDKSEEQEVLEMMGRSLFPELAGDGIGIIGPTPLEAAALLVNAAAENWNDITWGPTYRDDITLVAARVRR